MGAIWELINHAKKLEAIIGDSIPLPVIEVSKVKLSGLTIKAIPDLIRLVEWVKSANHLSSCDIVTHWTENSINDPPCSCGLSDIQKLLEE